MIEWLPLGVFFDVLLLSVLVHVVGCVAAHSHARAWEPDAFRVSLIFALLSSDDKTRCRATGSHEHGRWCLQCLVSIGSTRTSYYCLDDG